MVISRALLFWRISGSFDHPRSRACAKITASSSLSLRSVLPCPCRPAQKSIEEPRSMRPPIILHDTMCRARRHLLLLHVLGTLAARRCNISQQIKVLKNVCLSHLCPIIPNSRPPCPSLIPLFARGAIGRARNPYSHVPFRMMPCGHIPPQWPSPCGSASEGLSSEAIHHPPFLGILSDANMGCPGTAKTARAWEGERFRN